MTRAPSSIAARILDASAPALRPLAVASLTAFGACHAPPSVVSVTTPGTASAPSDDAGAPADGTLVEQIASSERFTCARMNDGAVRCWGDVPWERGARLSPVPVAGLGPVREIAAGDHAMCAVLRDATVACIGPMRPPRFGDRRGEGPAARPAEILAGAAHVAVGRDFACAVLESGSVSCWGANDEGQLGEPPSAGHALPAPVPGLANVREIRAEGKVALARLGDGSSRIWGARDAPSSSGQRWRGLEDPAPGRSGQSFVSLRPLCATTAGQDVSCGVDTSTPFTPPGLAGLTRVAAAGAATGARFELCGVEKGEAVRCAVLMGETWEQTPIPAIGKVRQLSVSHGHRCALLDGGQVRCWGDNDAGQLGDGTLCASPAEPAAPVQLAAPAAEPCVPRGVLEVATVGETDPPSDTSFALIAPGHVSTWRIDVARGEMTRTSGRVAPEAPRGEEPYVTSAAAGTSVEVVGATVGVCRGPDCTTVRPRPSKEAIRSAHLSGDAKTLGILRGSREATSVELYDVATSHLLRVVKNPSAKNPLTQGWWPGSRETRFVGDTFLLATCLEPSGACEGHLYDPRSGASLGETKGNPSGGRELHVSGNEWVFVSGTEGGASPRVDLVDVKTGRYLAEIALPWSADGQVPVRAFLHDASTLVVMATGSSPLTGTAVVVDLPARKVVKTFAPPRCGAPCPRR